jgi:hypothetical protein
MLVGGLVSGFSHCSAMCGPFVVMQSSANMSVDQSEKFSEFTRLKNSALLPYHLGRITTYTILAAIAGYMSAQILAYDNMRWLSSMILAISGIIFISYVFWGSKIKSNILKSSISRLVEKYAKPFFSNPRGLNGYFLGVILGFIPCGMIYAAIMAVATTGSVLNSSIAMILFGLGTIPGLFSVSYGSKLLLNKFKIKNFQRVAIFVSGIVLLSTAYGIIGI